VHINPKKHGHVGRSIDWPHSTLHRYIKHGLLAADWACASPEGTFGE
jgi:putative transposase